MLKDASARTSRLDTYIYRKMSKYTKTIDWLNDNIYWPVLRFVRDPEYWFKDKIYWPLQGLFRGYSDCDLWGLDSFIVRKTRPALKAFVKYQKERGHGCPGDLYDKDNEDNECHKWVEVLEKIELAFDLMWEDDQCTDEWFKKTSEQHIEDNKKIEEGLKLFAEHFQGLWD